MSQIVLGSFVNEADADAAIAELEDAGYLSSDISFISQKRREIHTLDTDVASGTASGAVAGAALGGLAGLLAGTGAIPVLAGLFIGGPIAVALGLTGLAATAVSGAVTGALAGGLVGALVDLGLSEEVAHHYEAVVHEGGVVLGVPVRENGDDARAILSAHGASEIHEITLHNKS